MGDHCLVCINNLINLKKGEITFSIFIRDVWVCVWGGTDDPPPLPAYKQPQLTHSRQTDSDHLVLLAEAANIYAGPQVVVLLLSHEDVPLGDAGHQGGLVHVHLTCRLDVLWVVAAVSAEGHVRGSRSAHI